MQWQKILSLFFLLLLSPFHTAYGTTPTTHIRPGFESAEHVAAGNKVLLYFTMNDSGKAGLKLSLPNSINLTYGEILSLGDFYGAEGPISEPSSEAEQKSRFLKAFNEIATKTASIAEIGKILNVVHQEEIALIEGAKKGESPEQVYQAISEDVNRQFNCISGGGCNSTWYLVPGRYLILASRDVDHFGSSALSTYQVGHNLAIEKAIEANKTNDLEKLKLAYAMNAFASHFLSDRFSAGHIRTPRTQLRNQVTPDVVGSLLAKYMHDEENHYGVYVHNLRGDQWLSFGDKCYFAKDSLETRVKMQEALQESANEVFVAFKEGLFPKENHMNQLIPYADEDNIKNIVPLFSWDDKTHQLLRRVDTENIYDRHLTADWWGWSTFILLSRQRGLPTSSQGALALSGVGKEAVKHGLITDRKIIEYINTR